MRFLFLSVIILHRLRTMKLILSVTLLALISLSQAQENNNCGTICKTDEGCTKGACRSCSSQFFFSACDGLGAREGNMFFTMAESRPFRLVGVLEESINCTTPDLRLVRLIKLIDADPAAFSVYAGAVLRGEIPFPKAGEWISPEYLRFRMGL